MRKRLAILLLPIALFLMQAHSVFACGGLVAPDGEVVLSRATTLVAWHNGIEHYLTTFQYQGNVSRLGWIVPLPAVPLTCSLKRRATAVVTRIPLTVAYCSLMPGGMGNVSRKMYCCFGMWRSLRSYLVL